MRLFLIRKNSLQIITLFSIAVIALNFLAIIPVVDEDMQNVDMSVLTGHYIAIDPGHGGIDDGASANHVIEKEITLAISKKMGQLLEKYGARVIFTRESDIDYYTRGRGGKRNDLLKRVEMIENSGAELFISIHCNAFRSVNLSGAQVFYSPKFAENKIVAERLQQAIKEISPNNKRLAKEDKAILLLNGIRVPGVMVETGYVTNHQESILLADPAYQDKLVEHLVKGLAYHFSKNMAR